MVTGAVFRQIRAKTFVEVQRCHATGVKHACRCRSRGRRGAGEHPCQLLDGVTKHMVQQLSSRTKAAIRGVDLPPRTRELMPLIRAVGAQDLKEDRVFNTRQRLGMFGVSVLPLSVRRRAVRKEKHAWHAGRTGKRQKQQQQQQQRSVQASCLHAHVRAGARCRCRNNLVLQHGGRHRRGQNLG